MNAKENTNYADIPQELFVPAQVDQSEREKISRPSLTAWQDGWLRLKQNKAAVVSLFVIIAILALALLAPIFSPYDFAQTDYSPNAIYQPPSLAHPFGTDGFGRDQFTRIWYGTRISLLIGVLVVALSALLSRAFTRKIRELLQAIRQVREGAYSHRASVRGNDEIAQLATEFNSLTDRLQTTEAARRRFVSDASHELKTPLAGIRLLTDSILQTEDMKAGTTREFVEDIGREAQRLSRITEDLLRLTRLDSGIQDAAYPVSVSRVLERVVRMLGVVAREKEVTLTYETDEDAVVRATEDDIHQILYNLMENGIKYSGSMGFVHTTLKTVGDTVVISVEDNGIGIPNEDMEHIFERFYRVDKNRSRAVGGTGLGLSIVSDTVRRRGGSIRAQHRQSGSGTVFIVELPLARREEADE